MHALWLAFPLLVGAAAAQPPLLWFGGETGDAAAGSGTYYADTYDGAANCAGGSTTVSIGANAEGATDGVYTTDETAVWWEGEWVMAYPATALTCTGNQTVTLRVRKSASGGADVNYLELYTDATDDGDCSANLISTYCDKSAVSSSAGEDITCVLPCTVMPDTWPQMQLEVSAEGSGGGPNTRGAQLDSITWSANWLE